MRQKNELTEEKVFIFTEFPPERHCAREPGARTGRETGAQ